MAINSQIKHALVIIVGLTIACIYTYLGNIHFSIKQLVRLEGLGIFIISTLLIYKGNNVIKEIKKSYHYIINIIITTIFSFLALVSYKYFVLKYNNSLEYNNWIIETHYIKAFLVIGLFNLMCTIYFISKQIQQKTIIQEPVQIYETSKKDAELIKLRHQINPHFLFNALNSINALMQFDKDKARSMIVNLSQYYRNIINVNENQWQYVEKELNDIQLYCNIEKIRFGHRLDWEIHCEEALKDKLVPPLLYQPLVENAIKYGLYGTLGTMSLQLKIYKTKASSGKEFITFQISNPFDHTIPTKPEGTGFGLENIKKRLYLLFATYKLFTTKVTALDEQHSQFNAYLSIPLDHSNYENKNTTHR